MMIRISILLVLLVMGQFLILTGQSALQAQQPVLEVNPTQLSFEGQAGGPRPDPQYLTIANTGGGVMEWEVSADADWIILGAEGGKLSGGRAIQMLVWVETEDLEAGEHHGTITISSPDARGSPVQVMVTLKLTAPPRLEVTPTSLSFEAEEGGPNPEPQAILIKNAGGGLLNWTATTDANWLILGANRGSLAAGLSVEVKVFVDITGLAAGTYQGRITVTAPQAQGSPAVVKVSLQLEAKPRTLRVPKEFSTIREAIDSARDGDTILIGPGTYRENLKITKSLTLRGAGQEKTVIEGARAGYPVVRVESDSKIKVQLEDLALTGAQKFSEDQECAVEYPKWICPDGLQARGKAQVTLTHVRVSDNRVTDGLFLLDSSQVTLKDSQVSGNGYDGLLVEDDVQVTIEGSLIEGNGTNDWCQSHCCCSGIEVWDNAYVEIKETTIRDNTDWGISAFLRKCGHDEDIFYGKVLWEGRGNQIYDNGQGDVCLP